MEGGAGVKLSLVIPAYNESAIIEATLRTVTARLADIDPEYELIVVDDGSTDGMADLVRPFESEHVRALGYRPNRGKGCAVRTGMLAARGEYVFHTDADLAYGLENIPDMLSKFEETGADLVVGSRKLNGDGYRDYPPLRLMASKCFSLLTRMVAGMNYDTQCGIKGFTRDAARAIFSKCTTDGFAFDFEVLLRAKRMGLRVEQEAVTIFNHRDSKVNVLRDSLRMYRDMLRIRRQVDRT